MHGNTWTHDHERVTAATARERAAGADDLDFFDKLRWSARMFADCVARRCPIRPWRSIVAIGLALAYTIVPTDALPEVVLGPIGLVDDLGVWLFVWGALDRDLKRYIGWYRTRTERA